MFFSVLRGRAKRHNNNCHKRTDFQNAFKSVNVVTTDFRVNRKSLIAALTRPTRAVEYPAPFPGRGGIALRALVVKPLDYPAAVYVRLRVGRAFECARDIVAR